MESERKFFDIAKKLSKKSTYVHQLGAVVVKKRKPVGFGYNQPNKTHPKSNNRFQTLHAELHAILGLTKEDTSGATIYVYREHKNGLPANSKPCEFCQMIIKEAGIKRVCYTGNGKYEEYVV